VLDLRDCCTGSYEAAIRISDMLLDDGVITLRRGNAVEEIRTTATKDGTLFRGPVVVLANSFTSGPAEVIAAAIQDNDRGALVGLKTNGTASEQKFIELANGAALFLTYARYHTPSGRSIMNSKPNLAGVKPEIKSPPEDFAVSLYIDYEMATGEEAYSLYRKYMETVFAKQLEKAVETLKQAEAAKPPATT
jgi:carboxyl-terminal processing protease